MLARSSNSRIVAYQAVACLTAALVFLQAVLAGQFLFSEPDARDIHEGVANLLFITAAAQLLLAAVLRSTFGLRHIAWNVVLLVLVISQIGLGYSGRDEPDAAAVHVPMGVLVFGLSTVIAALAFTDASRSRAGA